MAGAETFKHKPGWGGCSPSEGHYGLFKAMIEESTGEELYSFWSPKDRPGDLSPTLLHTISSEGQLTARIHDGMVDEERERARALVWGAWDRARHMAQVLTANVIELPQPEVAIPEEALPIAS